MTTECQVLAQECSSSKPTVFREVPTDQPKDEGKTVSLPPQGGKAMLPSSNEPLAECPMTSANGSSADRERSAATNRPRTPLVQSLTLAASGGVVIAAGWLIVRVTLTNGAGVYEARFLANQAGWTLSFLLATLILTRQVGGVRSAAGSSRSLGVLWLLLPMPFTALLMLPYGLRSLANGSLVFPVAVTGVVLWRAFPTRELASLVVSNAQRRMSWVVSGATVSAALALVFLFQPMTMLAGDRLAGVMPGGGNLGRIDLLWIGIGLGISVSWLWRSWGRVALLVGAAVVVLGGLHWFPLVALLLTATIEFAIRATPKQRPWLLACAALLLVAACTLSWAGLLVPMATWARVARRGWLATLVVIAGTLAMALPPNEWGFVAEGLLGLLLVLPFAVAGTLRVSNSEGSSDSRSLSFNEDQLWRLIAGLALATVALRTTNIDLALIPTALLWCSPANQPHDQHSSNGLRAAWLGTWLVALSLGTGYPWLRPTSLLEQLATVQRFADANLHGIISLWTAVALVLVFSRSLLTPRWQRLLSTPTLSVALLPAILFGLWGVQPRPLHTVRDWPPLILSNSAGSATFTVGSAEDTSKSLAQESQPEIWIDSSLANAAQLAAGTTVARITLTRSANSRLTGRMVSGVDTAEWRLSSASLAQTSADSPLRPPFAYWWSDDQPAFLGRRFRTRIQLMPSLENSATATKPLPPASLLIERNPELPANLVLRIDRIAVSWQGTPGP